MSETHVNTSSPPSNRAAMVIVFLVVFIDLLGFGIVLPILPQLIDGLIEPAEIAKE